MKEWYPDIIDTDPIVVDKIFGTWFMGDKSYSNSIKKCFWHADGKIDGGYGSLCEFCMGCGEDNRNFIPVGEQV